jgi:hypothetical protein
LEGASAEEAVPFPVAIHRRFLFVGTIDGIRILRALPLNKLRQKPATANGFREPRMQDTPESTMTFM